jgi:hypothetical protein
LQHGHLRSWNPETKVATTDSDGKFSVNSPPEGGMVVAVGNAGFASAPLEEVRTSGRIVLQPFGRIEGTMKSGGQPAAGRELLYSSGIPGIDADFNDYKATTDDQGNFSFETVPPGEGGIVRLVRTSPNSWTHSDRTSVTVQPGQTTRVTLGDSGATLKGTVRFEIPPADSQTPNIEGFLSSQMSALPTFNSPADAQAFYSSPEWQALAKLQKHYAIAVNPDKSFSVEDVVPGTYSLNFTARKGGAQSWTNRPFAQGQTAVTVPDSANPLSPINVGEILLKSMPAQSPGPTWFKVSSIPPTPVELTA